VAKFYYGRVAPAYVTQQWKSNIDYFCLRVFQPDNRAPDRARPITGRPGGCRPTGPLLLGGPGKPAPPQRDRSLPRVLGQRDPNETGQRSRQNRILQLNRPNPAFCKGFSNSLWCRNPLQNRTIKWRSRSLTLKRPPLLARLSVGAEGSTDTNVGRIEIAVLRNEMPLAT